MNKVDQLYLDWLYSQVASVKRRDPHHTYWNIFRILFTTEFLWFVPNDDNRIEDGKDLRDEFVRECNIDIVDEDWFELDCSMLELMIGMAKRLSFEDDRTPRQWFWEMMHNIGFYDYNDATNISEPEVKRVLDRIIWRTYKRNGSGGFFPLRYPRQDQRQVELWYQLNAYLLERD